MARYWFVIVAAMVLAGGAAVALVNLRDPTYSAHALVAARPASAITDTRTIVDLVGQMGDRRVTGTLAQAFTSSQVRTEALTAVGLSAEAAKQYRVEANVLPDTHVIEVSGSGPDPNTLATYLNATVTAGMARSQGIFRVIDLERLEPARPPEQPSSPVPSRDIPLGVGLCLLLGILLAFLVDYLRGPRGVSGELRALPTPHSQLPVRRAE
jgi:uncharacterized protein involved in exopolysaccharide biosynthesis